MKKPKVVSKKVVEKIKFTGKFIKKQRRTKGALVKPPVIPAMGHLDYRIVLNNVWDQALRKGGSKGEALAHREAFEDLTDTEHWLAAMVRALGKWETDYYRRYGQKISRDGFEANAWREIWQQLRTCLSLDLGKMNGRLTYDAMCELAYSAGFTDEEIQ